MLQNPAIQRPYSFVATVSLHFVLFTFSHKQLIVQVGVEYPACFGLQLDFISNINKDC